MLDRYQVDRCIGRGGMAEVFHGQLLRMGGFAREVAVKILLPHLVGDPEFVNMLMDEARIAATINHPNVVQMLDVGQEEDTCYLVMEYVDGIDLRSVERRQQGGRVPQEPLLFLIAEVLRGLSAIHNARDIKGKLQKVVHRDVTPSNVLLTRSGMAKLADFGIAHAEDRLTQTRHGAVKGKTRYMAPEQLDGRGIDPRTDLFAVGVVLLEALLGRDASESWHKTAMGPLFKIPAQIPSEVPADLTLILERALQQHPADRYETAMTFRKDVLRALYLRTQEAQTAILYGADDLAQFVDRVMGQEEIKPAQQAGARPAQGAMQAPHQEEEPSQSLEPALFSPGRAAAHSTLGRGPDQQGPSWPPRRPEPPPSSPPGPPAGGPATAPMAALSLSTLERALGQTGTGAPAGERHAATHSAAPWDSPQTEPVPLSGAGGQAGPRSSLPPLPLLSLENDAPTATAARSAVTAMDSAGTAPTMPVPMRSPFYPSETTLSLIASAAERQAASLAATQQRPAEPSSSLATTLATLASEPADLLIATAVTVSHNPMSRPEASTLQQLSPLVLAPIEQVPDLRSGRGLRNTLGLAAQQVRLAQAHMMESTLIRSLQGTLVRVGRNRMPLRLLVTVLSGMTVALLGLVILYKVQGPGRQTTPDQVVPQQQANVEPTVPAPKQVPSQPEAPRPQRGRLVIDAPPGSKVIIDGNRLQAAPAAYEFPPGEHLLRLTIPHHRELTKGFQIRAGEEIRLSFTDR